MTGNTKVWRAPLAGLASVAMIATMGVTALSANAADTFDPDVDVLLNANGGYFGNPSDEKTTSTITAGSNDTFADELYGDAAVLPAYADGSRTFTGWYSSASAGQAVDPTTVEAGTTLYAHWSTKATTVVYDHGDAVEKPAALEKIGADDTAVLKDDGTKTTITLSAADKVADWQVPSEDKAGDAKLFQGSWNGSGTTTKPYKPVTKAAASLTFNATGYEAFDQKGNKVTDTPVTIDVEAGKAVADTISFVRSQGDGNYVKLVKWKNGDAEFNFNETLPKAGAKLTLTPATDPDATVAAWKVQAGNDQYDGRFFVQDGSTFDPAQLTIPGKDGYTATGKWYVTDAATDSLTAPGDVYDLEEFTADYVVNATTYIAPAYTEDEAAATDYEFTFDPFYDGSAAATVVKVKGDSYVYDQIPTPTREGYKFAGWFETTTAANDAADAADGEAANRADTLKGLLSETTKVKDLSYTFTTDGKVKKITFYAGWKLAVNNSDFVALKNLTNNGWTKASFREYTKVRKALFDTIKKETGKKLDDKTATNATAESLKDEDVQKYAKTLVDAKNNLVKTVNVDLSSNVYGFTDVNAITPHNTDILSLAREGIASGFQDGTFRPTDQVNRQDLMAFLYRLAGSPAYTVSASDNKFTDVTPETPHYKEILWAAKNGIAAGFPDGTFGGTRTVVRQDAMAFLYRTAKLVDADSVKNVEVKNTFSDIDTTAHSTEVLWAANSYYTDSNGIEYFIAQGYADGQFKGMNPLYRQDIAAFLVRLNNYLG